MFKNIVERIDRASIFKLIVVIFLLGFFLYARSLFNGFVYDDHMQIVQNPSVHNLQNIVHLFQESTYYGGGQVAQNGSTGETGYYYKPLMSLTFTILYFLFGTNATGYHFFDIVLHSINVVLLFLFLKKLFSHYKMPMSQVTSFLGSLIFLIHPVNADTVVFIGDTQELLYAGFLFLSLFFIWKYIEIHKLRYLFAVQACFFLGLLSKEAAVIIFPLVVLLAILLEKKVVLKVILSFLPTLFLYAYLRFGVAGLSLDQHNLVVPIMHSTLWQRLATIPSEIWYYIKALFSFQGIYIDHDYVIMSFSDSQFIWPLFFVIPIALVFISVTLFLRSSLANFFMLWVVLSLGMVSNIIPLDTTTALRWLYVPIIGIIGWLSIFINKAIINPKWQNFTFVLFIIVLGIMIFVSEKRIPNWYDDYTILTADFPHMGDSSTPQLNYSIVLEQMGKTDEAIKHVQLALYYAPSNYLAFNNLGALYEKKKDYKKAEHYYLLAIGRGDFYNSYYNLIRLKYLTNHKAEAFQLLSRALSLYPDNYDLNFLAFQLYSFAGDTKKSQLYLLRMNSIQQ